MPYGDAQTNDGLVLLAYQRGWVLDILDPEIHFLTCEKSRRIGITWASGAAAVLLAADSARPQDVWYIAYKESLALEFVNDCADWARKLQRAINVRRGTARIAIKDEATGDPIRVMDAGKVLTAAAGVTSYMHRVYEESSVAGTDGPIVADEANDILTFRIRLSTGHRISALTSAPKNLRGLQGVVIIDEAAFHEQMGELLKAAMAFLMWGGKVVVVSTHDGVDNPFNQLCEEMKSGRRPGKHHAIPLRRALDDGLYRRICRVLRRTWTQALEDQWVSEIYDYYGAGAAEELDCVPAKTAATYISGQLVEACMYEHGEQPRLFRLSYDDDFSQLPEAQRAKEVGQWCEMELAPALADLPYKPHYLGFDFGRTSDLTVFAPCTLRDDLVRHVPFLIELRNLPHMQQLQILVFLCDRLPALGGIWADAGGNGSFLAEAAADRYGPTVVEQVKISLPWYAEHLPPLRAALQDRLIALPRDLDVRNDLTAFRLENGTPKLPSARTKGKDDRSRHGDAGIALAMMYAASRQDTASAYWNSVRSMDGDKLRKAFGVGFGGLER